MIKSPSTNEAPDLQKAGGNSSTQNETAAGNKLSKLALSNNSTTPARSSTSTSTAAPWMRLSKDPRIVRVSRAFGGKDRHSKVCTVRGLRDRRVRLSVPTAIQLYDLQDRLGLNQPSKVVDWLLDATKDEIDQLPPLPPMPPPPGSFGGRDGGGQMSHHHNPSLMNITASSSIDRSNMWMRSGNDEEEDEGNEEDAELGDDDHRKIVEVGGNNPPSTSNNQLNYPLFFPGLLNSSNANPPMPSYGFHHNWEDHQSANFPIGFTAHHHHHHQPTTDNVHNFNVMTSTLPSALSLSTGTTQSYFPDHQNMDVSRFSQLQQMQQHHQNLMASSLYPSSSQHSMQRAAAPHNLMSMITKLVHSQPNDDKDHEPPSK